MRKTLGILALVLSAVLLCLIAAVMKLPHQQPETRPTSAPTTGTQPSEPEPVPTRTLPTESPREPADTDFVRVRDYLPGIAVELKYAAEDNFTGRRIYEFTEAYLRYGTVKKLMAVQSDLAELGLSLKIWDAFRPPEAQFRLWDVCPDPTYVSDPNKGFSKHSRGGTLDVTLVDSRGSELEMPTGFDDFSARADRDYSDCSDEAAANAMLLQNVMENHGFSAYWGEWWHFNDTVLYEVEEHFLPPQ